MEGNPMRQPEHLCGMCLKSLAKSGKRYVCDTPNCGAEGEEIVLMEKVLVPPEKH